MPSEKELRAVFLGDEGAGKTTLLATLLRYLALTGMPNDYYFEDLNEPRRRHIGGDAEEKDPWPGGADVRAVTAEVSGGGQTWLLTDLAGSDHLAYLAAAPRRPDAAVITVSARTGLGREGIRQVRACAKLVAWGVNLALHEGLSGPTAFSVPSWIPWPRPWDPWTPPRTRPSLRRARRWTACCSTWRAR